MSLPTLPYFSGFSFGGATAAGGTVFTQLIPPYGGDNNGGLGTGTIGPAISRLTTLKYFNGATAHALSLMRPLNYALFSADAAAGQKVVSLATDPGIYSTSYKYPTPGGVPKTADNALAASDYCVYQCPDGTWVVDLANSSWTSSTGAATMTTNLPTGGVKQGGLFYFFGLITDTEPSTGQVRPVLTVAASNTGIIQDNVVGLFCALHRGDPIFIYSPNGTNAGVVELAAGIYTKQ